MSGFQALGDGEYEEWLLMGIGFLFEAMNMF